MADLNLLIRERIFLNNTERGADYELQIQGIENVDNRILTIPTGSNTEIFKYSNLPGAGTFTSSSFKYGRITNHSNCVLNLQIQSSSSISNYKIEAGGTFMLSTSETISGSLINFAYEDIETVSIQPSGSSAKIEYFIATL